MSEIPAGDDLTVLIPEAKDWAALEPSQWVNVAGSYSLAVGYSLIFWPRFVRFEGYVLREGFSEESLRGFEGSTRTLRRGAIEAVMNHVHSVDIHCNVQGSEAQYRYLGRVLRDIHEVKLRRDFPDLDFVVDFNDEPGLNSEDYQFTFWQT